MISTRIYIRDYLEVTQFKREGLVSSPYPKLHAFSYLDLLSASYSICYSYFLPRPCPHHSMTCLPHDADDSPRGSSDSDKLVITE